jgi:hypothetical protein
MAISYITSLRTTRITAVVTAIGSLGKLKIYTGTSPGVNNAASGTLLAVLTLAETACGTVTAGVLTFSAITAEDSALADGTAGYARITTSADAAVADLTVGATGSGADIILNNVNIVTGGEVSISSASITEGNA